MTPPSQPLSESRASEVPSQTQREALQMAINDGPIKRAPGGYWLPQSHTGLIYTNVRYLGTTTIKACEVRGWLESCGDFPEDWRCSRRITDAGRAVLASTPPQRAKHLRSTV